MKITILVDNRIDQPLLRTEHGLALWIEHEGRHILFDTGQGVALEKNAMILGIDLVKTDIIVLSHGHYDHTGGLSQVMRHSPGAHVYGHPAVVLPRYSISAGAARPVSMPQPSLAALQRLPETRRHWIQQSFPLGDGIGLSGPIPRETDFEDTGGSFFLDRKGERPDPLDDDMALWLRTSGGLVVCVGCAHAGLVNILNHVRRQNNGQKIRAVFGGFHLRNASSDRLAQTIAALRQLDPEMVVPCHCTGESAVRALQDVFKERIIPGAAGMAFRF